MENKTCFNLNEALANWRRELATQPGVSGEQVRELESHLMDAMPELQATGLREDEAFFIACRRLGSSDSIGAEMVKADPSRFWAERVLWMVIGIILLWICQGAFAAPIRIISSHFLTGISFMWANMVIDIVSNLFVLLSAIFLASGLFFKGNTAFARAVKRRANLSLILGVIIAIQLAYGVWWCWWVARQGVPAGEFEKMFYLQRWSTCLRQFWPVALSGFAYYLSRRLQKAQRTAA